MAKYRIGFVTREYSHAIIEIPDEIIGSATEWEIGKEAVDNDDVTWVKDGESGWDGGYDGEVWAVDAYDGDEPASLVVDKEWMFSTRLWAEEDEEVE